MKKSLLVFGTMALISIPAMAFNGSLTLGFEGDAYENGSNNTYSRSNKIAPYIKASVRPFPGNSLQIDASFYSYDQYNLHKTPATGTTGSGTAHNARFKTHEKQYEAIFRGWQYKNGGFVFAPRAGFRVNTYDINDSRLSGTQSNKPNNPGYNPNYSPNYQTSRRVQGRFYPNSSYNFNKQTQLYLSGWVGPVTYFTKGKGRTESTDTKAPWNNVANRTYTKNMYSEMEILGFKYTFNNKNTIWTSIYNEYEYQEFVKRSSRWQYRIGGDYRVSQNFVLKPYMRVDLSYKDVCLAYNTTTVNSVKVPNRGRSRDLAAVRLALAGDYRIDPDWSVIGEIYWNTDKQEKYVGSSGDRRNKWYYSMGVVRKF